MWKGLLRAMKKKIIITIQIENQCKDIFSFFSSCLHLGCLFLFFHACCLSFSYKACTKELNFSFCELWLCLSFSCRCSAQQEGLVRSVAFCPQNTTNMQLCRNIWIAWLESILNACMRISFSSCVGMMSSPFHGPLLLWCEQQRTLMSSSFCLFFFLCCNFFFCFLILLASSSKAGAHMSFYFWDGGVEAEMGSCLFSAQALGVLWPARIGSHNRWCTEMTQWKLNAPSLL